jgi:hypothetical protein
LRLQLGALALLELQSSLALRPPKVWMERTPKSWRPLWLLELRW